MSTDYEYLESLGAHHPVEIEVTVAQAEERERRGIPLPISGDPESGHAKELLAIGRARRQATAAPVVETEAADGSDASVGLVAAAGLVIDVLNDSISHLDFEVRPVLGRLRHEVDAFLKIAKRTSQLKGDAADQVAKYDVSFADVSEGGDLLVCSLDEADHLLAKRIGDGQVRHEDSFQLGAAQTGHGLGVLRPTVRGTTDNVADSFSAAIASGEKEGAAASVTAAPDVTKRQGQRLAAEAVETYDSHQNVAVPLSDVNMLIETVVKNELDGYPCPISGDPAVTLQEAIDRGAVTITKGLPDAIVWRRSDPGLAKTHTPVQCPRIQLNLWPSPSHQALTDSITALAGVQRRLMISGRLGAAQ